MVDALWKHDEIIEMKLLKLDLLMNVEDIASQISVIFDIQHD